MLSLARFAWVSTCLLFCLCVAAPGSRAAGNDSPNSVQSLDYAPLASGTIVIRLGLKQALAQAPAGFRTFHPAAQIVLDFPNTTLVVDPKSVDIESRLLRSIRLVQSGTRSRLVIRLQRPASYETALDGNHLLVTLRPAAKTTLGDRFQRFGADVRRGVAHRIHDVDFRRGASGAGIVMVRLSGSGFGLDLDQQGRHLILDFADAGIASEKELRLDVQDFATPVYNVETRAFGNNVRMRIEIGGSSEYSVYQTGLHLNVAVMPAGQQEVTASRYR